jgi:hypothetical protein
METPRALKPLLAPLVLAACILGIFHQSVLTPGRLTPQWDNLDGANPLRVEAARQWRDGRVPLWNPYKRAGMPLLADTTAAAIYPGNVPYLFSGWRSAFAAMDVVAVAHFLLAGLAMFAFLRMVGLGRAACVVGGLVYAGNGTLLWLACHYIQMQNSAAWLPLILLGVHGAALAPRTWSWVALGAASAALQFFAGYPEYSVYSGLLAIAYGSSLAGRASWSRAVFAVGAVYTAGIALAAVQLLPSLELQSLSRREIQLSLEAFQSMPAAAWNPLAWALPILERPFAVTPPPGAYHVGAVALFLAACAFTRRAPGTIFFGLTLAVGYLLSIGSASPLSAWAYEIPGLSAFRHAFKHLLEVNLALAGLAALGFDHLLARPRGFRAVLAGGAWTALAVLCAASLAGVGPPTVPAGALPWPSIVALSGLALVAVASAAKSEVLALFAVIVPLSFAYWLNVEAFATNAFPEALAPASEPELVRRLEPGWRVVVRRQLGHARSSHFLLGDFPTEFRVLGLNGAGPFLWKGLAEATGMVEEELNFDKRIFLGENLTLPVLSCRYVVATRHQDRYIPPLSPLSYSSVFRSDQVHLMERRDAYPRLRFVETVACSDAADTRAALVGDGRDLSKIALIDCADGYVPPAVLAPPTASSFEVIAEEAGRVEVRLDVPEGSAAFFVISQADYPGWRALLQGSETPIRRAYGLVQGVEVPGGKSLLTLEYRPTSVRAGAAAGAATAILLLFLVAAERRRRTVLPAFRDGL